MRSRWSREVRPPGRFCRTPAPARLPQVARPKHDEDAPQAVDGGSETWLRISHLGNFLRYHIAGKHISWLPGRVIHGPRMLAYQSPTGRLTRKKVDDREMSQCTDGTGFLFHR